jgi:hypothetical protein
LRRALLPWLFLQAGVAFLGVLSLPFWAPTVLATLPYAHGAAKEVLLMFQILALLRLGPESLMLGLALILGLLHLRFPRLIWLATPVLGLALQPIQVDLALCVGLAWLALNLLPWALSVRLAYVPGISLLFPLPLLRLVAPKRPWLQLLIPPLLSGVVILAHTYSCFFSYEPLLFAPWPDARVDSRVQSVAHSPAGIKSDFHGLDRQGHQVVVVAEGQTKLLVFDADHPALPPASAPLPPWWGPTKGLVMDSEIDPRTGLIYALDGPKTVSAWQMVSGQLQKVQQSVALPVNLTHTYMHLDADQDQLYLFTVGARSPQEPAQLLKLRLSTLSDPQVIRFHDAQGQAIPTTRDIAYIPPLRKFLLMPDMGEGLYLASSDQTEASLWLKAPTLNGKPRYIEGYGLLLPMPERMEIWLIDPQSTQIRRIHTQPGVRAADIDTQRGLLLTASVLTGQVWVQDLEGRLIDHFGTLMPMVRELVVDSTRGDAWLSTWTTLYRIPYQER